MSISHTKRKKPPGRPFEKGNPGGPGRRPMHPEDKKLAKLTRTEIKVLINRFAQFDIDQLEEVLRDKKRTVLEHLVGRIFLLGIKEGDYRRMDAMLDRMIGKVKEEVEIKLPTPYIVENIETGKSTLLGAREDAIDAETIEGD